MNNFHYYYIIVYVCSYHGEEFIVNMPLHTLCRIIVMSVEQLVRVTGCCLGRFLVQVAGNNVWVGKMDRYFLSGKLCESFLW